MEIEKYPDSTVAIIRSDTPVIDNAQQVIEIAWSCGCDKLILPKNVLPETFFDLKTGLAGEMLQKFATYRFVVAIIGDFSMNKSKSLNDFIFECNKGRQIFFLSDEETALKRLESI